MALDPRERLETDALPDKLHQSVSTTSGSISRADSIAIRVPERQPCPEGFVPLQQLCDNCSRFFASWVYLDWYQESRPGLYATVPTALRRGQYTLCIIAHVLQSQDDCHFCKMVVSLLPNAESSHPAESIALRVGVMSNDPSELIISCEKKNIMKTGLYLRTFEGKSHLSNH
jgi:hypothetical protein